MHLLVDFRKFKKLTAEIINASRAIKLDKEYLRRLDPSFESSYQYLFHAGFRALRLYRISHALYVSGFKFLAYLIYHINRILYTVDIHPAALLEPGVVIDHGAGLVIGSTAVVGSGTVLYHGVTLGAKYITKGKRHPTVGRNVIIGAGAKVLGPVYIGDNAKIGANSVVISDVPKDATAVGIPARIVFKNNTENANPHLSHSAIHKDGEGSDGLCFRNENNLEEVLM
ncbi:serine O-acetyltransferase EpsC [Fervidobacterium pennivorans]|uniref:serine O-acetyltransferase EpsC n=1 Tax=Fervidobacterium pennivorans TaxID=93466 RepID=UPI003CCA7C7C